jgi:hypothetical protein
MKLVYLRTLGPGGALISALLVSAGPAWAGGGFPAPLVGVTGPFGIVVAAIACGGYFVFKRYRNHD